MADGRLFDRELLDAAQAEFVTRTLEAPRLVEDLSWGLVDTRVLRVRTAAGDVVVKAAGPNNHHIGREITAYEHYTAPVARADRVGTLIAAGRSSNALITAYQPGELVEGTSHEYEPELYRQAGRVLKVFHGQAARVDDDYERRATEKAVAWLGRPHRIDRSAEAEARRTLGAYRPLPITVVPTHGDWQPRNWLIDGDRLRVIDFGRFDFRPAATDLGRLAVQQWREVPSLESAFLAGYGDDPREDLLWRIDALREAIGTAVWAFQVGDTEFEAHGHRMLAEALALF